MNFQQGQIHRKFQTKSGKSCIIRWVKESDLRQLTDYINQLAEEDTYILYSPGDNETPETEKKFVDKNIKAAEEKNGSFVVAEIDEEIIGTCGIDIDEHGRKRSKHVAVFGISILKPYRGEGIGDVLMSVILEHATTFLSGIRLVRLTAFAENKAAVSLYKKHGFVESGIVPGAYLRKGKYSDEITMYKEIA